MNTEEFRQARAHLQQSDEELAESLGVAPELVRDWDAGRSAVPKQVGQHIDWLVAGTQRHEALRTSGLPECEWMKAHEAKPVPEDPDATLDQLEAGARHAEKCPVCSARERFVAERFGPMPPLPQPGWMRIFSWIERLPSWARPAAAGAAILGAIVSVRIVFALPFLISAPAKFGGALVAVIAAAGAGAAGGFAYTLTRPTLRRLGIAGDYLTGLVCVFAYMGALAAVFPIAFGETLVDSRSGLIVFAVVSTFFGLVVGHTWFRGQSAM